MLEDEDWQTNKEILVVGEMQDAGGEDDVTTVKNEIIATARCYENGCDGTMEGRKGEYKYAECGLNSVILKDILVFHCTKCNAIVPEIPAAGVLHRVIALRLLRKRSLLTGGELRFLRKLCGYSINDLATIMGSTKTVVSRWETQSHGKNTERTIRLLVVANLIRELAGQKDPILRNVTVEALSAEIENTLKLIQAQFVEEKYEISPEEIASLGGEENREPLGESTRLAVV
jgi:transcriptional regulator with XRE-family HTH domain